MDRMLVRRVVIGFLVLGGIHPPQQTGHAGQLGHAGQAARSEESPLPRAHSHNDYHQPRPLLDALDHGFCNIEADIYLVEGALLVGHDRSELRADRTLQALYLDPLRDRAMRHDGRIYPHGPECVLLVDIKSEAETTFAALHDVLRSYGEILSQRNAQGEWVPGAVTVVISGNRAADAISAAVPAYAGWDGRIADLSSKSAAAVMPMISDNWGNHFRWRGSGPMPDAERQQLRRWVHQAHQSGRRVRFWNTPEHEAVWNELLQADVDLINTDDLPRLSRFLRAK